MPHSSEPQQHVCAAHPHNSAELLCNFRLSEAQHGPDGKPLRPGWVAVRSPEDGQVYYMKREYYWDPNTGTFPYEDPNVKQRNLQRFMQELRHARDNAQPASAEEISSAVTEVISGSETISDTLGSSSLQKVLSEIAPIQASFCLGISNLFPNPVSRQTSRTRLQLAAFISLNYHLHFQGPQHAIDPVFTSSDANVMSNFDINSASNSDVWNITPTEVVRESLLVSFWCPPQALIDEYLLSEERMPKVLVCPDLQDANRLKAAWLEIHQSKIPREMILEQEQVIEQRGKLMDRYAEVGRLEGKNWGRAGRKDQGLAIYVRVD